MVISCIPNNVVCPPYDKSWISSEQCSCFINKLSATDSLIIGFMRVIPKRPLLNMNLWICMINVEAVCYDCFTTVDSCTSPIDPSV